jgi:hypothetical protein
MFDQTYKTPEGFELYRQLLMPDARSFSDVLEYVREWDYEHMNHRNGELPAGAFDLLPKPRHLPVRLVDMVAEYPDPSLRAHMVAGGFDRQDEIGPFCNIDMSQLGGLSSRSIAVRATDAAMAAIKGHTFEDGSHYSFKLIAHEGSGRVLVILDNSATIGSTYVAYVDPKTIPAYPFEPRDAAARVVSDEIKAADHTVARRRSSAPFEVVYQGFTRAAETGWRDVYHGKPITIKADGEVVR